MVTGLSFARHSEQTLEKKSTVGDSEVKRIVVFSFDFVRIDSKRVGITFKIAFSSKIVGSDN